MRKKLLAMALVTAMTVSLTACGGSGDSSASTSGGGSGSGNVAITIFNSKIEVRLWWETELRRGNGGGERRWRRSTVHKKVLT